MERAPAVWSPGSRPARALDTGLHTASLCTAYATFVATVAPGLLTVPWCRSMIPTQSVG